MHRAASGSGSTPLIDLTADGTSPAGAAAAAGLAPESRRQQVAQHKVSQHDHTAATIVSQEDVLEQKVQAALRRDKYPVGPKLHSLLRQQEAKDVREYYGPEHLRRVLRYECRRISPSFDKIYCKKVHDRTCKECKTCHFCRQKTIDLKTSCACANSGCKQTGGRGRGIWCGNCLQLRIGENINEVLLLEDWRCPACRHICNCSSSSCQRAVKGLLPTEQLHHEARNMGYKSVAHYLILTTLDEKGFVHPMADVRAADRQAMQRRTAGAQTAQQQGVHGADMPGSGQTAAALRAQNQQSRLAAQRRNQEMLAAVAAALPPVAHLRLESAMAELGMAPAGASGVDMDDDDDDDDVLDTAGAVSSGMFDSVSHSPRMHAATGNHRSSSAGSQQQRSQQQQQHQRSSASNSRPSGHAGIAHMGIGLTSPRPVAGRTSDGGLPQLGIPPSAGLATTSPISITRHNPHGLPELGLLGGTGVLGLANFADTWRDKMASPVAGAPAAPPAGASEAEAGSRPAAAAAGSAAIPAPPQQPQQQQRSDMQQRQQQEGQQEGQQQAQQHNSLQQRLRRLQAAEENYGPNDLPGGDAPGYRVDSNTWQAPLGSSIYQRPAAGRQREISGWLSAAAPTSRRPAGARQPPGTIRTAAGMVHGTTLYTSRAGAAAMGEHNRTRAAAAGPGGEAHFGGGVSHAAGLRSAEVAELADDMPSKRIRLDEPASIAAMPAAAAGEPAPVAAGAGPQEGASMPMPAAAPAASCDRSSPEQFYQQQQQQQRAQGLSQTPGLAAAVSRPAVDMDETEAQHNIRQVKRAAKLLEVLQERGLVGCSSSDTGSLSQQLRLTTNGLEQKTFNDWDSPLVVNRFADTEAKRAAATANLQKLQTGVEALLVLAETLPLVDVRFAVVGRLDGSTGAFLDFQHSDPIARATLLNAWHRLMNILINRANPGAALYAAEVAASITQQGAAGAAAAERAVQKAVNTSIEGVQCGLECLMDLVNALLAWLSAFQEEYGLLHKLQYSPQDLLGPVAVGHLKWTSAHLPQQTAAGAAWHLQQQEQLRQDEVRQQRLLELNALAEADSNMVLSLLTYVCELCPRLPRKVAAALLGGEQLAVMLELKLLWPVHVCKQALVTIKALTAAAAPDLQEVARWYIEEPAHMKGLLVEAHRQQQQTHDQQNIPGLHEVVVQQLALFHQVVHSQIAVAQRVAEVSKLAQAMKQHLLLPLEQLVAAEYAARHNWVKDNVEPKPAAVQQPQQQQQTAALPWYLQKSGVQPAAAAASAAGVGAAKMPSVQQQEEQEQHCVSLGTTKVEALALAYAIQLQGGAISWLQMERQLVAPASSLNQLLEAFQNQQLRRLLISIVAEISKHAPSVVQWRQQQQGPLQPAASSNQTAVPAEWLLRLWLRAMLDVPNKACRKSAAHLTVAMLNNPAAVGLFQFITDAEVQRDLPRFQHDLIGHLRARWACQVAKSLLAGSQVASISSSTGAAAAGGLRYQELRDMLAGLSQVLRARQSELQRCGQHSAVLLWQRACMPTMLGLAELVADTLATGNCLAPGAAGTTAAGAPAPPPYMIAIDLKKSLMELLGLASSWIRAGIAAVCGRGAGGSSGDEATVAGAAAVSGEVDPKEAMSLICESSALAELQKYLAVLVHLAGLGCKLDDISTDQWPADASNSTNNSRSLRQVWAQITSAQRAQLQQQRMGGCQHQHASNGQALSVPCLSELVLALVQLPSAGDRLKPNEQGLFSYVAEAFAGCGGLMAAAAGSPGNSPGAATAGSPTDSALSAAAPKVPEGYRSPGLLHLLLGSYLRVLLDASSDRGTLAAHSKAVNALHLVRALFDQPGVLQEYGQQLLLPCLARPLVKLLGAAAPAASPAVQFQVFQLLQQLLDGQCGQQMQQRAQEGSDDDQSVGWSGCLRAMTPLDPTKYHKLLQLLLTASIRASIGTVAAPVGQDTSAAAEDMLRRAVQRKQQQQQQAIQLSQAGAAPAAAPAAGTLQYVFPLRPTDTQALELQLQNFMTGSPPVVSTQLSSGLVAADTRISSKGIIKYGAERPEDYSWSLAKAALAYLASVAKLQGHAQQQVLKAMPFLLLVLQRGSVAAAPLLDPLAQLIQHLPESTHQVWRDRIAGIQNAVKQKQQEQQRMAPPTSRPVQAGQPPAVRDKQQQQCCQQQQQQQQRPPQRPPQQKPAQQQQQQRRAVAIAAAVDVCGSQAASVACRQHQRHPNHQQEGGQQKRPKVAVPAHSEVYSGDGGRAASCSVLPSQQQALQPSQRPQQRKQQQPAVSAVSEGSRSLAQRPAAAAAAVVEEDVSSHGHRADSAANEQAGDTQPQPQQQSSQQLRQADTSSQDQAQQKVKPPSAQQQQGKQPPRERTKFVLFGSLVDAREDHCGQFLLTMCLYADAGRGKYQKGPVDVTLSGAYADCARALCKQGRIKPGVLLGISDMLQTSKYNDFVPSDTSKLYLDPHNSSISSKQAAKAAGGAATSGKENKAVAAMSGEGKVAAASVEAVAGALQVAPAANSNTVAGVTEVAAKQHQETDGQTAHLVRTSSTTWWPQMLKKYEQMKCMYEKQVQHRRMRATQSTASQRTVSQAAEQRAGQCPSAAASVPTQHENPAVAPATIIEDSQATIKYVTQATEV